MCARSIALALSVFALFVERPPKSIESVGRRSMLLHLQRVFRSRGAQRIYRSTAKSATIEPFGWQAPLSDLSTAKNLRLENFSLFSSGG